MILLLTALAELPVILIINWIVLADQYTEAFFG